MRAVVLNSFDGIDGLELADVPAPETGDGEVSLTVRAASIGSWDLSTASGAFAQRGGSSDFPQIQGWDFAGETDGGERVIGFVAAPFVGKGALAERLSVPPEILGGLPDSISFEDGAALPVIALTARLLIDQAQVAGDDLVLVSGAAGMVGGAVVELAKVAGARVVAAVREGDADAARALGADEVVATGPDLESEVRGQFTDGVDAVIDTIGLGEDGLVLVRDGGRFVTAVPTAVPGHARGIEPATVAVSSDGQGLGQLATLVTSGRLTVRIAHTLPLAQFREGYEAVAAGGLKGKVVFTV